MSNSLHMKYFVLKPAGKDMFARASRFAMRAYARFIRMDKENEQFSDELREWADREFAAAMEDGMGEELERDP